MSNRDIRLTKPLKCSQFVTLFCQIIKIRCRSEVTAICHMHPFGWFNYQTVSA